MSNNPVFPDDIEYSETSGDAIYSYRKVVLPKMHCKNVFLLTHFKRLLSETECRELGVLQSRGWIHYRLDKSEPQTLFFRRYQAHVSSELKYFDKYYDDMYEYRDVILSQEISSQMNRTLSEDEWRELGIQQSRGWVHHATLRCGHYGSPILVFRRPLGTDPKTGKSTDKILTLKLSWVTDGQVRVNCTSMAGSCVAALDLPASAGALDVLKKIAEKLKFQEERLQLLLPSGQLFKENGQTLADLAGFSGESTA